MAPLTLLKFPLKAGKARRFRFQDSGPILLFADLARGAVGTQAVDLFFELSDSPVVGGEIILLRRDVADLGLDHCRGFRLMVLLRPEYGTAEGLSVDPEQFLADLLGKIRTGKSCLFVIEMKRVFFLSGSEYAEHAIRLVSFLEGNASAVNAAAPWPVAQALVSLLIPFHFPVKSVKHHFKKDGKGRFAPAVFRQDRIERILEHIGEIGQSAEMLNM